MQFNSVQKILIAVFIAAVIISAAIFIYASMNITTTSEPSLPLQKEPLVTLNVFITEAMTVYASAPYKRYTYDELHKYFVCEIADSIHSNYEAFYHPDEETPLEFEEQSLPEIEPLSIQLDNGEYAVKLRFGEVYYNYRLTIAPSRIITRIIDGGITFE